jgi:transposase-like protein
VIYRWLAERAHAERMGTTPEGVKDGDGELARLRRENGRLRQERDFLRQAAAFFARESK